MSEEHHTELGPEPSVATFIRKIYAILEDGHFPEVVDWNSDGSALIIKKPSEFGQKVLPRYFKHNHISSFIRQLNMYGFQKKRSRQAGHIYIHELFQRGQKHLLARIKRKIKDGVIVGNANSSPHDSASQFPLDSSALFDENQLLKGMKEEAFEKMKSLEEKIKELTAQNQKLVEHLQQQKQKEQSLSRAPTKQERSGALFISPILEQPTVKQLIPSTSYCQREPVQKSPVKISIKQEATTPEKLHIPKISPSVGISFTIASNTFTLSEFGNRLHGAINSGQKKPIQKLSVVNPFAHQERNEAPEILNIQPAKKPSTLTVNLQNVKFEDGTNLPSQLGKRALDFDEDKHLLCEDGIDESINKFLRCDSPGLDLRDFGKLQSGFMSNWGENEGRQRFDSDFDLICFH